MTTILAIRHQGRTVLGGDGQVTLGQQIQKHSAVKVRTLRGGEIVAGFAGGAADAMSLMDRFSAKLEAFGGQLMKASVELAKEWRSDRALRRLEAVLIVANVEELLLVTGTGDVISPDDGVVATGSGGAVALAAARALVRHGSMDALDICSAALRIAAEIDLHTNDSLTILEAKR